MTSTQPVNPDLHVGVVIDGPQIDGTTQELFDYLAKFEGNATLDIGALRFTVTITRLSQKGL